MTKLKNFSVKLTKDQFNVIASMFTKAGMRWRGDDGEKIEDWNPHEKYDRSTFFLDWVGDGMMATFPEEEPRHPLRTFSSLVMELQDVVSPAKRKKPKVSNPIEYKVGEHFPDWESLTPYEKGTILEKGRLVVLVKNYNSNRVSTEHKLGTILIINQNDMLCPHTLPETQCLDSRYESWQLAPLPTGRKTKAPKPTWTTRTEHERSDNILIQKDTIRIDGKVYTIDEAKALEVKLRAAIRYWKANY